jgi:RNA polymerase sigma-70 factor (subfamily 1)
MVHSESHPAAPLVNGACAAAVTAARLGSSAALGALLEPYRSELLELAVSELGSTVGPKESASDIVQEALLDAVSDFSQFQGATDEELRGWLRRIVRNRSMDAGRRYRQAEMRDLSREVPLNSRLREELAGVDESPSTLVSKDEAAVRLLGFIERLPEPHRTTLQLRYRDGKSFVEIGAEQKCSPFRARRMWYEALLLLQRELKERS